ncbi:hypothetical protein GWI33_018369 [Rhynchophorus ferrugineus]|uniref:Uncharacterized protein n=1 Tax=Rhynchophorus ferrugineus TaxID=354439 RepID=A0A834M6F9_RHYFE|nr:hypothetical protein GWI33_018369 [Rhynchophorus ferrugineus]
MSYKVQTNDLYKIFLFRICLLYLESLCCDNNSSCRINSTCLLGDVSTLQHCSVSKTLKVLLKREAYTESCF